jgi:hypothetical protein
VLVHALFENPPKVLNRVEVWWIGRPVNSVNVMLLEERFDDTRAVYTSPILHKQV